ncbi:MAG: LamG-like jellyroll fold domain-containing protein [Winogradskyella sp.]|uniref:LamG-like jellyroll fold domain-containing protein n=1 Tax=Winogradskyella sp. TaxID=1883156 RepID=UPI00385D27CA
MISITILLKRFLLCTLLMFGLVMFAQNTLFDTSITSEDIASLSLHTIQNSLVPPTNDLNSYTSNETENLDGKFQLYFDGIDDYIEDTSLLSEWTDVSLMGWIKIDPTVNESQVVFGQNNFSVILSNNNSVIIRANDTSLKYSTPLPTNQWVHLSAVLSNETNTLKLYVNGLKVTHKEFTGALKEDNTPFYIGRKHEGTNHWYFKGHIDEVRLFNKGLSDDEIQKMVYQEIQNGGTIRGAEVPRNITTLSWDHLIKYYRFDSFRGAITDNLTTPDIDVTTGARLHNMIQIVPQTAPMPFRSQSSGHLASALTNIEHGINGYDAITYDWSIVNITHNDVTFDATQKHLSLVINEHDALANPIEFHVTNDSELNVSWYLKLDGFIDLEGESQLVQGEDSMLDSTSIGKIERDQQGTADTFTYNYWSSPVKRQNSASDNFRIMDVMHDGSDSNHPEAINFSSSGYDGAGTNPIQIADYWIWKYANLPSNTYSAWQHIRRTGNIFPGEGFTMKGPGTGSIDTPQNYVFSGMPNNGDINLPLAANNDYLLGNPYPSAIDANRFIRDNGPELGINGRPISGSTPLITGTLYFWEHWSGGSHFLQDYQGGYATYNYSGGVRAAYKGNNHPDLAFGSNPTEKPGRYIPVGQGFFIVGQNSGTIKFNNSQRIFRKEGNNSIFISSAFVSTSQNPTNTTTENVEEDLRMKFRIGFNSVNTIKRELLLTIDDNATPNVDWAYDGILNETQMDDMYWIINDESYIIQASNSTEVETTYPLGIKTNTDGINTIMIDALENIPNNLNVYLHDIDLDVYHDLRTSNYDIFLNAGEYLNRFEITFSNPNLALSIEDDVTNKVNVLYSSAIEKIVIVNPSLVELNSMEVYNILGQSVYFENHISDQNYSEYQIDNLSPGTYIIKLQTATDRSITKKIIVK